MRKTDFSPTEIDRHWQQLIKLGPRFLGTPNEINARNYILTCLSATTDRIEEQEFSYQ